MPGADAAIRVCRYFHLPGFESGGFQPGVGDTLRGIAIVHEVDNGVVEAANLLLDTLNEFHRGREFLVYDQLGTVNAQWK